MIKASSFGIKDHLIDIFDNRYFRINTRETYIFRKLLQEHLIKENYPSYITLAKKEYNEKKTEFDSFRNKISHIKYYLDVNYDLLYCMRFCEPQRHIEDERFRYAQDKIAKRANLFEYDLLEAIADQWRLIAEITLGPESVINPKKYNLPKKETRKTPIEYKAILDDNRSNPILPKKEAKKRGFFSWLK